jgi:DNA-binding IclR family transcriptional regulator
VDPAALKSIPGSDDQQSGAPARVSIKSAERALDVLSYLASKPCPVPSMVIARSCQLPRSSAYQLLNVLWDRGYVTYYRERRAWGLGAAMLPLADGFRRSRPVGLIVTPLLDQARLEAGGSWRVEQLQDGALRCCAAVGDAGLPGPSQDEAGRQAHASPGGVLLLAYLPPSELDRLYPLSSPSRSSGSTSSTLRTELLRKVAAARRRGIAIEARHQGGGMELAAPVLGDRGAVIAALVWRVPAAPALESSAQALKEWARRLSVAMSLDGHGIACAGSQAAV